MARIFLSLGSNKGDKAVYLKKACSAIRQLFGYTIVARSSIYETSPVGMFSQLDFLNQVLEIDTQDRPHQLIEKILIIEQALGRVRSERPRARTIDIDILLYGSEIVMNEGLTIPHPCMCERLFVMEPLEEIAPDFYHPHMNTTIHELTIRCREKYNESQKVTLFENRS